jgi:hypothetical protein
MRRFKAFTFAAALVGILATLAAHGYLFLITL